MCRAVALMPSGGAEYSSLANAFEIPSKRPMRSADDDSARVDAGSLEAPVEKPSTTHDAERAARTERRRNLVVVVMLVLFQVSCCRSEYQLWRSYLLPVQNQLWRSVGRRVLQLISRESSQQPLAIAFRPFRRTRHLAWRFAGDDLDSLDLTLELEARRPSNCHIHEMVAGY